MKFSHLHVHTQFSLLDGAASIKGLYNKALADGMPALAISDHGNMFGVFEFVKQAYNHKNPDGSLKVKPIVGCEFYITENRHQKQFTKDQRDPRHHQILLAKNAQGYKNLMKLTSLGFIEGMYSKYPRIDKQLISLHHEGLIATTCCLGALVPQLILKGRVAEAEQEFKWWLDLFGEDYYVEVQRHGMAEQDKVNEVLIGFARKYNVKIIASNDSHYVDEKDFNAHDILLCLNTGEKQSTPAMREFADDDVSMKNKRFAFPNNQFYLKNTAEMMKAFENLPEAIDNTNEVIGKIDTLNLKSDILLPHFRLPEGFQTQESYLEHLTWTGARERYGELTPEIEERINFELFTIKTMGFSGYFLIVSDFVTAGKKMGVFVGPGRGSAAGSVVAYCIGITNIDPIKYKLLFERFLNPDRKSMPDIDTDFDDEGRQKVMDYVVDKYGKNQVAQIITYGTMAAKMSIKDVARVLDLPLGESNMLAKLVPDKPGTSLRKLLRSPLTGPKSIEEQGWGPDDIVNIRRLKEIYEGDGPQAKVLREAEILEGSVRNTGVHASAVIIAPSNLLETIPVAVSKDSDLLLTQIDGGNIEEAGCLKMDFLGLKTLSILKTALGLIKQNHGVDIDLDALPLDDEETYKLFQRGDTNGTFQFESPGMQKHLRELKPDKFADLIAMNALYRPGPLAYIPNYIERKHGRQEIHYDLPEMQEILEETYGITVYQEQVMLLSQKLAGFSKGQADILRKAMGKKDRATLDKMKGNFLEGAMAKGFPEDKLAKIWTDWEAFAQYAFNKSHSTCYAIVAYQTAYLKAHYPPEYMAAVLNNQNAIDKITFHMEECQRMELDVLGPDVNESLMGFSVNKNGVVRFGLNAIKGVGENAVEELIAEREKNGPYTSVADLVMRVNHRSVGKKTLENLVLAGAMDCFEDMHRAQYFHTATNDNTTNLDKLVRFGQQYQASISEASNSLFGEVAMPEIKPPAMENCTPWTLTERLEKEKDLIGIYLSAHPLDGFKFEMERYGFTDLCDLNQCLDRTIRIAGYVSEANHRVSKKGSKFGVFKLNDYTGNIEIFLNGQNYVQYGNYMENGQKIVMTGVYKANQWSQKLEFDIQSIMLLEDVRRTMTRRIQMKLELAHLNGEVAGFLTENFKKHPGQTELLLHVSAGEHNIRLRSNGQKILLNDELLEFLEGHPKIQYLVETSA